MEPTPAAPFEKHELGKIAYDTFTFDESMQPLYKLMGTYPPPWHYVETHVQELWEKTALAVRNAEPQC